MKCVHFQGTVALPSHDEMVEDISAKEKVLAAKYVNSIRHTIQVEWVPYMDELATFIGCKPNFSK